MDNWLKKCLLSPIIFCSGFLPLALIRLIGGIVGRVGLRLSKKANLRTQNNLLVTGVATPNNVKQISRQVAVELGKTLLETVCIAWVRSRKYCYSLIKSWQGLDQVLSAEKSGRPIIFLTPHIGNFEIMLKATLHKLNKPITILYKPAKNKFFLELMRRGRTTDNIIPVETNRRGVLRLMRALKNNEHIGVLPDSVASQGDGVWVKFFNMPVFATTLLAKLISSSKNAAIFIAVANRVPHGFAIEFIEYQPETTEVKELVQDIYTKIEHLVRQSPSSYFWIYDRFRVPDHAPENGG
jgi:KDO2-lipid IV(A) lauroyltransferase